MALRTFESGEQKLNALRRALAADEVSRAAVNVNPEARLNLLKASKQWSYLKQEISFSELLQWLQPIYNSSKLKIFKL